MNPLTKPMGNGQQPTEATNAHSAALDIGRAQATPLSIQSNGMRVAIVHHWFLSRAGGERVFDSIASMFPSADVFTLLLDKKYHRALPSYKITTSFLNRIPAVENFHRHLLPF